MTYQRICIKLKSINRKGVFFGLFVWNFSLKITLLMNAFVRSLLSVSFGSLTKGTTSLLIIGLCIGLIPDWKSAEIDVTTTEVMTPTTTLQATTAETIPYINSSLVLALQDWVFQIFETMEAASEQVEFNILGLTIYEPIKGQ